jgi:uncharacterized protein (DUF924 family)
MKKDFQPADVLDFWFPDSGHHCTPEAHAEFWNERMQGGMDNQIITRFADLTNAAASGELDDWADTPRGRLALLIALDQFPRSLWRDTPAAFAQDKKTARLALDGIEIGHFSKLAPWEMTFFVIAISHCECPNHLERMHALDDVIDEIVQKLPRQLCESGPRLWGQHARVTSIIKNYGRHPHRNDVLSRTSTPEEVRYIALGDFPHLPNSNRWTRRGKMSLWAQSTNCACFP